MHHSTKAAYHNLSKLLEGRFLRLGNLQGILWPFRSSESMNLLRCQVRYHQGSDMQAGSKEVGAEENSKSLPILLR